MAAAESGQHDPVALVVTISSLTKLLYIPERMTEIVVFAACQIRSGRFLIDCGMPDTIVHHRLEDLF